MRQPVSDSDESGKLEFQKIVDGFLLQPGLPFANVVTAEKINRIFAKHGSLFGGHSIYSSAIVLWAFLGQVLRDGKEASCQSAVAGIISFCLQAGAGGRFSCSSPKIPAEALETAILARIREISASVEAREQIVQQALSRLDTESEKLRQEEDLLRRQQQRTRADIGRLVEVLKSSGAKGLSSVQGELTRLETEDHELDRRLAQLAKRQKPLNQITEDARMFIQNWAEVDELLDAANEEEKSQIVRHYVEVIELHASDTKGETGTYAMRLFPEVRPDWYVGWGEQYRDELIYHEARSPETESGDATAQDGTAASLTEPRLVCISDEKAPRAQPSS